MSFMQIIGTGLLTTIKKAKTQSNFSTKKNMFQIHEAIHSKATNNSSLIYNQIKTDKIRKLMTLVHVHLYQICATNV